MEKISLGEKYLLKEMNNRVWDLFNVIRGKEDITKVLPAALAVDRVKRKGLTDYREIYEALREEASKLNIYSLFNREDAAIHIYMDIPDEIDWGFLLQRLSETAGKVMDLSILPESLVKVMEGGFNRDPESVLIVEGEKFITRITEMIESHPGTHFTISSQREVYTELLKTITEGYCNASVVESNVYESYFLKERFDMILSSPAFGGRTLSEDPKVTIVACLRDGMEIKEDQTTIEEYAPGTWDKTTALDEFGVPYVYAADLEDIADSKYYAACMQAYILQQHGPRRNES